MPIPSISPRMRYLPIYVSWVLCAVILLIVATIEATHRSKERADCYRKMQSIELCPKPAWWEDIIRTASNRGA